MYWNDAIKGEQFRPFVIRPRLSVAIDKLTYVFAGTNSHDIEVRVKATSKDLEGELQLELPEGWDFYGTILGIFLVAFYIKKIGGHAVFIAAIIAEIVVLALFQFTEIPYLWFNFIGCVVVVILGIIIQGFIKISNKTR